MPYEIWAMCPKCRVKADGLEEIKEIFGFRIANGKKIPQAYCRKCR